MDGCRAKVVECASQNFVAQQKPSCTLSLSLPLSLHPALSRLCGTEVQCRAIQVVTHPLAIPHLARLQLASFQGGVDGKTSAAAEATPLPAEQMRPAGPITLAGVRHSYLWLADCLGRPFLVSLRHPGLRLRCLAARGDITTARTIAERGAWWQPHQVWLPM